MSLIHQRLYKKEEFTKINFGEYIADLVNSLMLSFGYDAKTFEVNLKVSGELFDIDQALPLGLIVNEIVTNAFKYAFLDIEHPALSILVSEDQKNIILSVKDNGTGLNKQQWEQHNSSFGKQLITALVRQLRGKQSIVVDCGTEFCLTFPKKAA